MANMTLGADPELVISYRNTVVNASNFVGSNSGCAEFGADGNGTTFELRPHYHEEPYGLVQNIRELLLKAVTKDNDLLKFDWNAGSFHLGFPTGGHIHFGMPNMTQRDVFVNNLDQFLAPIAVLLEDEAGAKKRREGSYGHYGDSRTQSHGLEYRVLSSWLTSPHIAMGILSLAKVIAHERFVKNLPSTSLVDSEDITKVRRTALFERFPLIWKKITQMELYPQYKTYIDWLKFLVEHEKSWFPKENMKNAWGLVDMSKISESTKLTMFNVWGKCNAKYNA